MTAEKMHIDDRSLMEFSGQMGLLLKSGFSLEESLALLREEGDAPWLRELARELEQTGSLTGAAAHLRGAPVYFTEMIRLGEETGRLDEVLEQLRAHYSRELAIRQSIRGAIAYPALLLGMLAIVLAVLLTRVLPVFDRVFAQLGSRLTGLSRALADLGETLRGGGLAAAAILAAVTALVLFLRRRGRPGILGRIPWVARVRELFFLCRFSGGLALVLSSGVSAERALELVSGLVTDPEQLKKTADARQQLEQTGDLVAALRESRILTGSAARLALVGQRSGTLDTALAQIAEDARQEADRRLDDGVALIEPVLVIVLSLVVGAVLLSVLMPMLGILSAL